MQAGAALIGQVDAVFRGAAIRERGRGREEKATSAIRRKLPRARIPSPPLNGEGILPARRSVSFSRSYAVRANCNKIIAPLSDDFAIREMSVSLSLKKLRIKKN